MAGIIQKAALVIFEAKSSIALGSNDRSRSPPMTRVGTSISVTCSSKSKVDAALAAAKATSAVIPLPHS